MARPTSIVAGLLGLALLLDGCSIAFVTLAPRTPALEAPACTNDYISPVLDTVLLGVAGTEAGLALEKSSADYRGAILPRSADIGLGLVFATVFAASALYGYQAVGECRARYNKPPN